MSVDFNAIELFSGAGGLSIGLEKAGFQVQLANEIEKDFAAKFSFNHPAARMINADIHEIDFSSEVKKLGCGKIHLVSGGPPCQGFSTVGSKNKRDPRNSLFQEYLRAVSEIEPDYILFENVSGFKKLYEGDIYGSLISELSQLGYKTSGGILEASNFGLPQFRQRTIVIGWRHDRPEVALPEPTHFDQLGLFAGKAKVTLIEAISDLPEIESGGSADQYGLQPLTEYQNAMRFGCLALTEHNSAKHGEKMREILSLIPPGGSIEDLPQRLRPKGYFKNTYARLVPHKPSPTITRNFGTPSSSRCVHPFQNRALSTREGARLQGFPDRHVFLGAKTSKNLQVGNAVPPIFGEIIAREIIQSLTGNRLRQAV